ncbi:hypothetical protein [Chryseobacterium sp. MEBOG07]|uniref:hypothetical protein n=1 Tax=Chryseobacterium sp. MEBOG07 TaxID=2879939 RepID=UPI001F1A8CB6|nr:hypothetical protein [Chryseobacterium sp. MEBOG07]UKB81114.1 hypothetical protein LF886_09045 [Chryseobacterium sp. MEBOG07]
MKTFTKYDYYIQLFFIIIGPQAFIIGGLSGFILFYFIVGIPQLISFLIKLFLGTKKSVSYIMYGIVIVPVWIIVMILFTEKNLNDFFGYALMAALLYSPVMAVVYVYDCYNTYEPYKHHPDNHLKN